MYLCVCIVAGKGTELFFLFFYWDRKDFWPGMICDVDLLTKASL